MKPYANSLIATVVLVISGCEGHSSKFALAPEFERATETYYGNEQSKAEMALVGFIEKVQSNIGRAKEDQGGDYRVLVGMTWLRLASIYRINGEEANFNQAMRSAITYFDQSPKFSADPKYQADKNGSLSDLLEKVEIANMPVWKKNSSSLIKPNTREKPEDIRTEK